jgi:hypothetical protein
LGRLGLPHVWRESFLPTAPRRAALKIPALLNRYG